MRAMGPGSVSSLLKIALDVVWYVLWALIAALLIAALAVLFVPLDAPVVATSDGGLSRVLELSGPMLSMGLLAFSGYVGGVLIIVDRLRKVFAALTAGDPFHPANVRRLRFVGLVLAALEAVNTLIRTGGAFMLAPQEGLRFPDLTGWFSVLVVFVLAEVFREGARLRREAELTI